jgi:hypothetical protein
LIFKVIIVLVVKGSEEPDPAKPRSSGAGAGGSGNNPYGPDPSDPDKKPLDDFDKALQDAL